MKLEDKTIAEPKLATAVSEMYGFISEAPVISASEFAPKNTALCIIDVVNGFVKFGALADKTSAPVIQNVNRLAKIFADSGSIIAFLGDSHKPDSVEFQTFPPHCTVGSEEEKIVDELSWLYSYDRFFYQPKNSVNAFLEQYVQEAFELYKYVSNFIVVGVCTDICVLQFAMTLKSYSAVCGRPFRVVVPADCVDTFGGSGHNKALMNLSALSIMKSNGIEIVKEINA